MRANRALLRRAEIFLGFSRYTLGQTMTFPGEHVSFLSLSLSLLSRHMPDPVEFLRVSRDEGNPAPLSVLDKCAVFYCENER